MARNIIFTIVLFLSFTDFVNAQDNAISNAINSKDNLSNFDEKEDKKNYNLWSGWSVGLNYGFTKFRGDVTQYDHYPAYQEANKFFELKTAFSFHVEKKIYSFYFIGKMEWKRLKD